MYGFSGLQITTKEELNTMISDEDIYFNYFGDFMIDDFYASPFRSERTPSFTISEYRGELKWRDFGQDVYPRDAVEFVMQLKSLRKWEAMTLIYSECVIGKESIIPFKPRRARLTNKTARVRFSKKYRDFELDFFKEGGISGVTLQKFKVYPTELFMDGKRIAVSKEGDPCYVYAFDIENETWKTYRPYSPNKRYKFCANNISNHVQGLDMIPHTGELLIITSSYKDVMVWYELGISAIAPHSEAAFPNNNIMEDLKKRFKKIVINYDGDETGVANAVKYAEKYNVDRFFVEGGKDPFECMCKKINIKEQLKLYLDD